MTKTISTNPPITVDENLVSIAGATARRIPTGQSPITLHEHNGQIYASGLFRLHDEIGFPLSASISECRKRGWIPCISDFADHAARNGWTTETISRTINDATNDASYDILTPDKQAPAVG
jgi:hypothetical protein